MSTMKKQRKGRIENPETKQFENFYIVAELDNNKCVETHIETESGYRFDEGDNKDDIRYLYHSADELAEMGFTS